MNIKRNTTVLDLITHIVFGILLFICLIFLENNVPNPFLFLVGVFLPVSIASYLRSIFQKKHLNSWAWILVIPTIIYFIFLEGFLLFDIQINILSIVFSFLVLYVLLLKEVRILILFNQKLINVKLLYAKEKYGDYKYNALKSKNVVAFLQRALQDSKKLIAIDEERATNFINILTNILRYLLQSRDLNLTKLEDEIIMAKQLALLHKLQSGLNVNLNFDLQSEEKTYLVPPFVLLMILDKVFLRVLNIQISDISIYVENDIYLVVKYNKAIKSQVFSAEFNEMIEELKKRYEIVNNQPDVLTIIAKDFNYIKLPIVFKKS